jgi:ribosomal protein S18 acetylase RimI-like enzyme
VPAVVTISNAPWSNFKESDYTLAQLIRATLIHPPTPTQVKSDYKLRVREPDGTLNKNGVFAAASALAGGRGGVNATNAQKSSAAVKLIGLYRILDAEPPESIKSLVHSAADDFIAHFGVKGMKWGVRKNYQELRSRPRQSAQVVSSKTGETVTVQQRKMPRLGAAIGAISPWYRKQLNNSTLMDVKVGGKNVGDIAFTRKSSSEVNFGWIGIKKSQRGKGYATAVFDAGVKHARQQGYSKISLEVPGNAPDARHIYEKFGFKPTGEVLGHPGDMWGGLTVMTYNIPRATSVRHSETLSDELERAFDIHFGAMGIDDIILGPEESSMAQSDANAVLEHFGVKGMKWGVRKADASSASRSPKTAKADKKWAKKASSSRTFVAVHNAAVKRMNKTEVSRINNKSEYKNKDFTNDSPLRRKYYNEFETTFMRVMNEESSRIIGPNASGTQRLKFEVDPSGSGDIHYRIETIKHANTSPPDIIAKTNDKGYIVSFSVVENALMQGEDLVNNFIEHFGVKGMKWGVRRDRSGGGSSKPAPSTDAVRVNAYKKTVKRGGTNALSTKELQDLVTRMNLEQQYSRLQPPSKTSRAAKFAADVLVNAGKQQATKMVNDALSKQLEKLLKKK